MLLATSICSRHCFSNLMQPTELHLTCVYKQADAFSGNKYSGKIPPQRSGDKSKLHPIKVAILHVMLQNSPISNNYDNSDDNTNDNVDDDDDDDDDIDDDDIDDDDKKNLHTIM